MVKWLWAVAAVVGLGCYNKAQWQYSIKSDNYSIVNLSMYPHSPLQIKYNPQEFLELRKGIEKYPDLLTKIVLHFYPADTHKLDFKYKYAAIYGEQIVLRYFSSIQYPDLYAGYSLEFVVEGEAIKEIYLYKTPLE